MKIWFQLIDQGKVIKKQEKEYDGSLEANDKQIQCDIYDGMDPLMAAKEGKPVMWIEGKVYHEDMPDV